MTSTVISAFKTTIFRYKRKKIKTSFMQFILDLYAICSAQKKGKSMLRTESGLNATS
jgi:hypothetical protein